MLGTLNVPSQIVQSLRRIIRLPPAPQSQARDAGVTEFVVKPITAKAILDRIQAVSVYLFQI